jgi:putative tryptophan/tyrosine transport system substrate-binding protein
MFRDGRLPSSIVPPLDRPSGCRLWAAELVSLRPKVIVASGSPAAVAARNGTSTIPIVFTFATDPVGLGLIASLARPGGNITGQSNQGPGLVGKRLQLLAEMIPGASHFGVVWTPSLTANHADFGEMKEAAKTLRLVLDSFEVRDLRISMPRSRTRPPERAASRCSAGH